MEGVGARLGRSSTRYGPTSTVFSGPVRKWKKKWVHVSPPNNSNASSNHQANHHHHNGTNGSHLLLYKWTPVTQSQNNSYGNNGGKGSAEDGIAAANATAAAEEPAKRKSRYIPVAVLEEQENDAAETVDDEVKSNDTDTNLVERVSKNDGLDEKPDINDAPMEETRAPDDTPVERQDLNESTLDLSLGLKAHDGDHHADLNTDQGEENSSSARH